jgi:Tol biopolymer transport system component
MTDVELLVRETLRRHEAETPDPDTFEAPLVAARARRRQLRNIAGAGIVATIVALAVVSGVGQLLRADMRRPANRTPTPPSDHGSDARVVNLRTGAVSNLPPAIANVPNDCCYSVSPDGTRIAFIGTVGPGNEKSNRIFVADVDGTDLTQLSHDAATEISLVSRPVGTEPTTISPPQWSPDGSRIVYERAGDLEIVVVDVDTGSATRVTYGEHGEHLGPTFSPDAQTILFTRSHRQPAALWTVPATGGRESVLLEPGSFGTYSPDGTTIAYTSIGTHPVSTTYRGIWVADADGRHPREVPSFYHGRVLMGILIGLQERSRAAWSPDGTRIAASLVNGGPVVVVDLGTNRSQEVARHGEPAWLDDHTLIIDNYRALRGT